MREQALRSDAAELARRAVDGVLVERVDGRSGEELRSLAHAARHAAGAGAVVLAGATPQGTASLAAATDGARDAVGLVRSIGSQIAGGGGGTPELALAGGKRTEGIDAALDAIREQLGTS